MENHADSRRPILLVEDNPMDIDLTKRALKNVILSIPFKLPETVKKRWNLCSVGKRESPFH